MKLAPLLAQYLLAHKELSLPGLGIFYAETFGGPESASIRFEQKPVPPEFDEAVVNYISAETGKMKVLATSDLTSQLEDVINFLNTGKPYLLTGIGSLIKKTDGKFDFVANTQMAPPKKKEAAFNERNTVPQTYIEEKTGSGKSKKSLVILLVLAVIAIGATVWFYSKTDSTTENAATPAAEATAAAPAKRDTAAAPVPGSAAGSPSGTVTYLLEAAKEARANKRYNQLKKLNWPVALEKIDSLQYHIVMKLNTPPADTARVRDSLSAISGRKVVIRY